MYAWSLKEMGSKWASFAIIAKKDQGLELGQLRIKSSQVCTIRLQRQMISQQQIKPIINFACAYTCAWAGAYAFPVWVAMDLLGAISQ